MGKYIVIIIYIYNQKRINIIFFNQKYPENIFRKGRFHCLHCPDLHFHKTPQDIHDTRSNTLDQLFYTNIFCRTSLCSYNLSSLASFKGQVPYQSWLVKRIHPSFPNPNPMNYNQYPSSPTILAADVNSEPVEECSSWGRWQNWGSMFALLFGGFQPVTKLANAKTEKTLLMQYQFFQEILWVVWISLLYYEVALTAEALWRLKSYQIYMDCWGCIASCKGMSRHEIW